MNATELQTRLDDAACRRLADLTIEQMLDRPVGELLTEEVGARLWRMALEGWVHSAQALPALSRLVEQAANDLSANRKSLRDAWPAEARSTVREMLQRPWSPDRQLVLTVIDRPPVRDLIRALLLETVLEFARKASAPMSGVAKGLGSFARMAGAAAKARSGGLGAFVGAVSGEVERQVEKRATEVVDAALGGVFGEIADAISNPRRAGEAAELRLAIFDGVLELTGPQLSRELINLDVHGGAEIVREGITRWLASAGSEAAIAKAVKTLGEREGRDGLAVSTTTPSATTPQKTGSSTAARKRKKPATGLGISPSVSKADDKSTASLASPIVTKARPDARPPVKKATLIQTLLDRIMSNKKPRKSVPNLNDDGMPLNSYRLFPLLKRLLGHLLMAPWKDYKYPTGPSLRSAAIASVKPHITPKLEQFLQGLNARMFLISSRICMS